MTMRADLKPVEPGASFGILTVVREAVSYGHGKRWVCRCSVCGGTHVVKGSHLRQADPRRCAARKSLR